jgi:DNA-binding NtrC family response regulator
MCIYAAAVNRVSSNREKGETMMMTKPQVLLVGRGRETPLKEILQRSASLAEAGTVPDMVRLLQDGAYDAVLCEREFSDGTWREALQELQARRVSTPAIVVSQTSAVDDGIEEWAEVLQAGAFDLLLAPSQEYSVLAVLEHAVESGKARALRAAG